MAFIISQGNPHPVNLAPGSTGAFTIEVGADVAISGQKEWIWVGFPEGLTFPDGGKVHYIARGGEVNNSLTYEWNPNEKMLRFQSELHLNDGTPGQNGFYSIDIQVDTNAAPGTRRLDNAIGIALEKTPLEINIVTAAPTKKTTIGITPGSYSYWSFDGSNLLTSIEFRNTVLTSSGDGCVYWSSQFEFNGNRSYIGMQEGLQNQGQFLWSTWDSNTDIPFKDGTRGSHCFHTTGEGRHVQCSNNNREVSYGRPIEKHLYVFRVEIDPGTHWATATVIDETAGESFILGHIYMPQSTGIKPTWSSWVEYFDWNNPRWVCNDSPYSKNLWGPMTGNKGTLTARLTSTSTSGTCQDMVHQQDRGDGTLLTELGIGQSKRASIHFTACGLCLDSGGAKGAITYPCANSPNRNQLFVFAHDGSLHTARGNECLTAPAQVGGQVTPQPYDPNNQAQKWNLDTTHHAVINPATGWALTTTVNTTSGDMVCAKPLEELPQQIITF